MMILAEFFFYGILKSNAFFKKWNWGNAAEKLLYRGKKQWRKKNNKEKGVNFYKNRTFDQDVEEKFRWK